MYRHSWGYDCGSFLGLFREVGHAVQELRAAAATRALLALTRSDEGRRGLLDGLQGLTAADPNLRMQMMLMLSGGQSVSQGYAVSNLHIIMNHGCVSAVVAAWHKLLQS